MAISEESRHQLYQRLEEALGHDEATVLMEHLPPVGWADVATRRDLDALEDRIGLRFANVDQRLDGIDRRLDGFDRRFEHIETSIRQLGSDLRVWMLGVMAMIVAFAGTVIAAIKL